MGPIGWLQLVCVVMQLSYSPVEVSGNGQAASYCWVQLIREPQNWADDKASKLLMKMMNAAWIAMIVQHTSSVGEWWLVYLETEVRLNNIIWVVVWLFAWLRHITPRGSASWLWLGWDSMSTSEAYHMQMSTANVAAKMTCSCMRWSWANEALSCNLNPRRAALA